eukprot:TRINITY_DN4598_c0_g1_i1.p1 TRINITY_DN4598_c0_g1~~TRINITY_DN4598_c0_g1_i1.p1  ORF type:complete len:495 (+),score=106.64 TRINITY_DN4598_c0_g1_i1:144-1628(+)
MSAIPYIGSRISLISKNEIRYEGILYSIDPKESKVALQNVRSYGTEDRKKEVIPPSNEVYDYIIFRGSEIKDLTVCEAPRQAPIIPDSAILAMPHLAQNQFNNFGGQPNYPNMNIPPNYAQPFAGFNPYYHSFFGFQNMNQQPGQPSQPGQQPGPNQPGPNQPVPNQPGQPSSSSQSTSQPVQAGSAQSKDVKATVAAQSSVPEAKNKVSLVPTSSQDQSPAIQVPSATSTPGSASTPVSAAPTLASSQTPLSQAPSNTSPAVPATTAAESTSTVPASAPTNQDSTPETSGEGQDQGPRYSSRKSNNTQRSPSRGGSAGAGQRGRRGGRYNAPSNGPRVLEEFDFESMNAKFDKVKVAEEISKSSTKEENENVSEEGPHPEVDSTPVEPVAAPSYNKTKSFFDNISCDALDRMSEQNVNDKAKGRKTYQEQRKLDEETFGRSGFSNRGGASRGGRGGRRYYNNNQPRENGTNGRENTTGYRGGDRQSNKGYNRQ